jgi:hypothetical protein
VLAEGLVGGVSESIVLGQHEVRTLGNQGIKPSAAERDKHGLPTLVALAPQRLEVGRRCGERLDTGALQRRCRGESEEPVRRPDARG